LHRLTPKVPQALLGKSVFFAFLFLYLHILDK
jgi:hypothetical protein